MSEGSWYDSEEHIIALQRHLSTVTVRDVMLYMIYTFELKELEALYVDPKVIGYIRGYFINRRIDKAFGSQVKDMKKHNRKVDNNLNAPMELANIFIKKKDLADQDTTLSNWFADLCAYFYLNYGKSEEQVSNMPYESVNELRISAERLNANERKKRIADANATEDTVIRIDHHVKRKSEYSRKIRLAKNVMDREGF